MNALSADQNTRTDFFRFAGDVNLLLQSRAGISYSEVAQSLHPGSDAPRHAMENGVTPDDFVSGMIADEGFLEAVADVSLKEAGDYNRAKTAIAEFVWTNVDWHRTSDAVAFAHHDDALLIMRPVQSLNDLSYGFGVEVRHNAVQNDDGTGFEDLGTVEARFAGFDIAQPVGMAREHLASRAAFKF